MILVLSGFMGVGKSSVGRAVAELCDAAFVDLDAAIETSSGMAISAIFDAYGESRFRMLERAALAEQLRATVRLVLSVGGGALIDDASRELAKERAFVVTLRASAATILRRTEQSDRPLLAVENPAEVVDGLLKRRASAYADCHCSVDTDGRSVAEVAADVVTSWRVFAD